MRAPLESLLNLKRWTEDDAKNALALLIKELSLEEQRLGDLEEGFKAASTKSEFCKETSIDIHDLKKIHEYIGHLVVKIEQQRKVITEKEEQIEHARKVLLEASREKKIFEKLEEKRKKAIQARVVKHEQASSDEHSSSKHKRQRG